MQPKIEAFIERFRPAGLAVEGKYGIPWRFAMVQAAHESRYGESKLTAADNNLFGYTAGKEWMAKEKPTAKYLTSECSKLPPDKIQYWEYPDDIFSKTQRPDGGTDLRVWRHFRKYDSWEASLQDWASLIERRYPKAHLAARAGDFAGFAKALEEGGYATDRDKQTGELVYAKKLVELNTSLEGIA